jgi:GNAT superfamily N-acetyltransferase
MIKVVSAKEAALSEEEIFRLYEIMRIAYALTEVEVWGEDYVRISLNDYKKLIDKDEILMAVSNSEIVGGIHYYQRAADKFAFSLLSADFNKSGLGIGRALIDEVAKRAKQAGANYLVIEILRPKDMEVPFKVRIRDWYERMGFVYTGSQDFSEVLPDKAKI